MAWNVNQKILERTAVGLGAALLVMIGVGQCSEKENARAENEKLRSDIAAFASERDLLVGSSRRLQETLDQERSNYESLERDYEDSNDSIAVLNDSLAKMARRLDSCKMAKAKKRATARKAVKVAPVKPQPKKDTAVVAIVACDKNRIEMGDNARNGGDVIINNGKCANGKNAIVLGNGTVNNGTIVINNGGIVNSGAGAKKDTVTQPQVPCNVYVTYSAKRWKEMGGR